MADGTTIGQIDEVTGAIKVEAEDLISPTGEYRVEDRDFASGGQVASLFNGDNGRTDISGVLSYTFEGEAGPYDIAITAFDENDGVGSIELRVNGVLIETFELDGNLPSNSVSPNNQVLLKVVGVELAPDDVIEITGVQGGGEWVRIDALDFTPTADPTAPTGDLSDVGVVIGAPFTIDLNEHFSDVNGDALTYSISGPGAAYAVLDGDTLTIDAAVEGAFDITVIANDGIFDSAPVTFTFTSAEAPVAPIEVEAETIIGAGFVVENQGVASSGEVASLLNSGNSQGELSYIFAGGAGSYDLSVIAFDETDGVSTVEVLVNGVVAQTFTLDEMLGSNAVSAGNQVSLDVAGLNLAPGAEIIVRAQQGQGEWVRIDKLTFTPAGPPPEPTAPTGDLADVDVALDAPFVIDLDAAFTDINGDALTYTVTGPGAAYATLDGAALTINASVEGAFDITVIANDGTFDSAPVVFTFTAAEAPVAPIEVEAETIIASGYIIEGRDVASNGEVASLYNSGVTQGELSYAFEGGAGSYDMSIIAHDENDGVGSIDVLVNGVVVESFTLDGAYPADSVDDSNRVSLDISALSLKPGDVVEVLAQQGGGEWVRIDKLTFTPAGPPPEPTAPTGDLADIDVTLDTPFVIDLDGAFADINGDALTYTISGPGAAFATLDGAMLTIDASVEGAFDITVIANDGTFDSTPVVFTFTAAEAPPEPFTIEVEAETIMTAGFVSEGQNIASNGEVASLYNTAVTVGELSYMFSNGAGAYDLAIIAHDESDGAGAIEVLINGEVVQTFVLDGDYPSNSVADSNRVSLVVEALELMPTDKIVVRAQQADGEWMRIDKLVFTLLDEAGEGSSGGTTERIESVVLFENELNFTNDARPYEKGAGSTTALSTDGEPAIDEASFKVTAGPFSQAGITYGRALDEKTGFLQLEVYRPEGSAGNLILRYNGFNELKLDASNYGDWVVEGFSNPTALWELPAGEWHHITVDLEALLGPDATLNAITVKGDGDGEDTYYFDNVQLTETGAWSAPDQTSPFLSELWASETGLVRPESAQYDPVTGYVFVSETLGNGTGKVVLLDTDGNIVDSEWLTGLTWPKGLIIDNGLVYVAAEKELVVANASTGEVVARYAAGEFSNLNDVTLASDGAIYVSDMNQQTVWRLEGGEFAPFISDPLLQGVNGVRIHDDKLWVATFNQGVLYEIDLDTKAISQVIDGVQTFDGVIEVEPGIWLFSSFNGQIRLYNEAEDTLTTIYSRINERSAADIGYDPVSKTVYVPTYGSQGVFAFKLHLPNDTPVSVADTYTTNEDTALVISADGVLTNDTDAYDDPLSAILVSDVSNGTLTLNADGSFIYTPNADFNGADSFTYKATDGATEGNTVTVDITVNAVNDAPTGAAITVLADGVEDTAYIVSEADLLAGFSDLDGDQLSIENLTADNGVQVTENENGTFTLTPPADFNSEVALSYDVTDGELTAPATQSVTFAAVNDAPVGTATAVLVDGVEDTAYIVSEADLLAGVSDVDGDELSVENLTADNGVDVTDNNDGTFTLTPPADFNGEVALSYDVTDGELTVPATQSVTFAAVNDAPVADVVLTNQAAAEDAAFSYEVPADAFGDVDGDALTLSATQADDTELPSWLTFDGATFTGTPVQADVGSLDIKVTATDPSGEIATQTFTLTIGATNDAPVSVGDAYSTDEDTALVIPAAGVLINDSDVDGDALDAVLVSDVSNGTLTLNADGSFTYTPNADFNGSDSFTYKANDGTADGNTVTVDITVNAVNDAPVGTATAVLVDGVEDTAYIVSEADLLAGVSDVDGDELSVENLTADNGVDVTDNNDGTFTLTPPANLNGEVALSYDVTDGELTVPATQSVTFAAVNDAPVADVVLTNQAAAEDAAFSYEVPADAFGDVDGDALTLSATQADDTELPSWLTFDGATFTGTPVQADVGSLDIKVTATDPSGEIATQTFTLTIGATNDAPVSVGDAYSTDEDTALVIPAAGVLINDSDVDGDALDAVLVSDVSNGTLTLNADGSFTYTPNADFNGSDSFTYKANDGTADGNTVTVDITVNAVNDAPVGTATAVLVDGVEDTAYIVSEADLLAGVSDVDGDELSVENLTADNGVDVTDNNDGTFTLTPPADFNGEVALSYDVTDGELTVPATQSVTFAAVNDAPVADVVLTNQAAAEDAAFSYEVPADAFGDVDGDALTLSATQADDTELPSWLTFDGATFTGTPVQADVGSLEVKVTATDPSGEIATQTFTLTIGATNDAPVSVGDAYSTDEDTALVIPAAGVLINDSDVDGDALDAVLVSDVSNGTLTLNADGSFTYTPNADFNGSDSFTYKANDGTADGNTVTVDITVNAVNDAPVGTATAVLVDGVEDTAYIVSEADLLAGVSDVDGDELSVENLTADNGVDVTDNNDGTFTLTPPADFNGEVALSYDVTDGELTVPATQSVTFAAVNDAPVADVVLTNQAAAEDAAFSYEVPADAFGDVDGDALTLSATQADDTELPSWLTFDGATFTGTPVQADVGSLEVKVTATDPSGEIATQTFTLTIGATNDAPVSVGDAYSTDEDTALVIPAAGVLINDSDVDGDALDAVLVSDVSNGTLMLNADGSFTYTPNADFNGSDSFTYKANDGTADGNTVTVDITVNAVNDAPVGTATAVLVDGVEDTAYIVSEADLLAGVSDVDGDELSVENLTADNGVDVTDNNDGTFTLTPPADFNGEVALSYDVTDGELTVPATQSVTFAAVNDAPVADVVLTNQAAAEDAAFSYEVPADAFGDVDGDALTLSATQADDTELPSWLTFDGATFTGTPVQADVGSLDIKVTATDPSGEIATQTFTLTIGATNDAPVSVGDAYSTDEDTALVIPAAGVLINDSDVDGDALDAVLVSDVSNGTLTLNADGSFTYTPNADFNGSDSFTYKANDGTADGNTVTVDITVNAVNDAPVGTATAVLVDGVEDTAYIVSEADLLAGVSDVDGDELSVENLTADNGVDVTDNNDGTFTLTPPANLNGEVALSYDVTDGELTVPATQSVTFAAVNDAPVADVVLTNQAAAEDAAFSYEVPADAFGDVDGDALTLSATQADDTELPSWLTFDGATFTGTPVQADVGSLDIKVTATDPSGEIATQTFTLTIGATNDAPVSVGDAYSTDEDTALVIPAAGVLINDSDVDGDALDAVLVSDVSNGTLTLNADGSFTYTPNADFNGSDSFTYKANDGTADGNTVTVDITVNAVNDAPVGAATTALSTSEDVAATFSEADLLGGFSDVDADNLSVANLIASQGELVDNKDGTFTLTPPADFNGEITLDYDVEDANGGSVAASTDVTVGAVNDAPQVLNPPEGGSSAASAIEIAENSTAAFVTFSAQDVDDDSGFVWSLPAGLENNDLFDIDADTGALSLKEAQDFESMATNPVRVRVEVEDASGATGFGVYWVEITDVNEAPVVTPIDAGAVTEDDALQTIDLLDGLIDPDGDALTVSNIQLTTSQVLNSSITNNGDGTVSIPPGQASSLVDGESVTLTINYDVSDGEHTVSNTATLLINGADDDAFIDGDVTGEVTEDAVITVSGQLTITDPDANQAEFVAQTDLAGTYGSLSVDETGAWSYTLDNDATVLDTLDAGQSLVDVVQVQSIDGTTQDITITVQGADEAPSTPTSVSMARANIGSEDDSIEPPYELPPELFDGSPVPSNIHVDTSAFNGNDIQGRHVMDRHNSGELFDEFVILSNPNEDDLFVI